MGQIWLQMSHLKKCYTVSVKAIDSIKAMASVSYTKETPRAIMNLLDEHKESITEHEYVQMCNYLQAKFKRTPSENIRLQLEPRRLFNVDERVLYNNRNGYLSWATIISRDVSTVSYIITIDGIDTERDTTPVNLFELHVPEIQQQSEPVILGDIIPIQCPRPDVKSKAKILLDVKYRRFMQSETRYSVADCDAVIILLGYKPTQLHPPFTSSFDQRSIVACVNALGGVITKEEFFVLIDDERNTRCRNSESFKQIKTDYANLLGTTDFKLAFD